MSKKKEIKKVKLKDIKGLKINLSLEVPKEEFDKLLKAMNKVKPKEKTNDKK